MYEQINMFDLLENKQKEKKTTLKKEEKSRPPEEFLKIYDFFKNASISEAFEKLASFGYRHLLDRRNVYEIQQVLKEKYIIVDMDNVNIDRYLCFRNKQINLVYFDQKDVYVIPISINADIKFNHNFNKYYFYEIKEFNVKKYSKKNNRIVFPAVFVQDNLMEKFQKNYPYAYEYLKPKNDIEAGYMMMAPELEQLKKAGYAISGQIINIFQSTNTNFFTTYNYGISYMNDLVKKITIFNRIAQNGTKIKNIFKVPKFLYETLKEERDLEKWDFCRKLVQNRDIDSETLMQILERNFSDKIITYVYDILGKEYQGKPVFTFKSLMAYLNRIDMYEAISSAEGLPILRDYLQNCQLLNMKPKIDGDSLKREHDVSSRLVREHHDEIMAKKMESACKKLEKYNYEEDIYFVRGITSYDDLIDEAKQQHNCVAGYANSIISQKSLIYVMREKKNPEKSLITLELSPNGKTVRQKFLAYNQPIRNRSQTEFINRWEKHCREIA